MKFFAKLFLFLAILFSNTPTKCPKDNPLHLEKDPVKKQLIYPIFLQHILNEIISPKDTEAPKEHIDAVETIPKQLIEAIQLLIAAPTKIIEQSSFESILAKIEAIYRLDQKRPEIFIGFFYTIVLFQHLLIAHIGIHDIEISTLDFIAEKLTTTINTIYESFGLSEWDGRNIKTNIQEPIEENAIEKYWETHPTDRRIVCV